MQRFITLTLAIVFCLAFAGTPHAQAAEKTFTMRIGTVTVLPNQQAWAIEEYKRLIDPKVEGRIKVQTYPASQLGTIPQHLQGLQNGSIQAVWLPNGFISPLVPVLSIVDLPFFFPDSKWMYNMFENGYREPIDKAFADKGLIFAASLPSPDRALFTNKPITKIEDFAGMRIRTYGSPINQQAIASWGATPVNIDSAEISVAIQQGTVDGIETDRTFWWNMKLFQANHYMEAQRGSITNIMVISKRWFDTLPADLQQIVLDTAKEVPGRVEKYLADVFEPMIRASYGPEGIVVSEANAELVAAMRERSLKVHDLYINMGPEFKAAYDYYKDLMEKFPPEAK